MSITSSLSVLAQCTFRTQRLSCGPWQNARLPPDTDLPSFVQGLMTPEVTKTLPPPWQGGYSETMAKKWVEERDDEGGITLLVTSSVECGNTPLGLVILFPVPLSDVGGQVGEGTGGKVQIRLGYMLAQSAWGKGYASEMLKGLTQWCQQHSDVVHEVLGGVARDNPASARVLVKNGYQKLDADDSQDHGEDMYSRVFLSSQSS